MERELKEESKIEKPYFSRHHYRENFYYFLLIKKKKNKKNKNGGVTWEATKTNSMSSAPVSHQSPGNPK